MVEIRVYLISPWEELENALRENMRAVKIMPFLNSGGPLIEIPYSESALAFDEFFEQWALIQQQCPDEMKDLIEVIFFSAYKPVIHWRNGKIIRKNGSLVVLELNLFELPFDSFEENKELSEITIALGPVTIKRMAQAVGEFKMELCADYFVPKTSKKFKDFLGLSAYSQFWIDHIEQASQYDCGIIVTYA